MSAVTITETTAVEHPMQSGFFQRGRNVSRVPAWIVAGETAERPYEISTRDKDRAAQYAAAIRAGDDALIEQLLAANA